MVVQLPKFRTLADVLERLGNVPAERVRLQPQPGTATVADVTRIQDKEGIICELVDGVLLEKTMGWHESGLAVFLAGLLNDFVISQNLGKVVGADGTMQIQLNLVRIPDVSFIAWERFPGRRLPTDSVPRLVPNLAAEILSKGNTRKEMAIKRQEYFDSGVQLVWEIDPRKRTVAVYTSVTGVTNLTEADTLDGGAVLPGFALPLKDLFGELDRHG